MSGASIKDKWKRFTNNKNVLRETSPDRHRPKSWHTTIPTKKILVPHIILTEKSFDKKSPKWQKWHDTPKESSHDTNGKHQIWNRSSNNPTINSLPFQTNLVWLVHCCPFLQKERSNFSVPIVTGCIQWSATLIGPKRECQFLRGRGMWVLCFSFLSSLVCFSTFFICGIFLTCLDWCFGCARICVFLFSFLFSLVSLFFFVLSYFSFLFCSIFLPAFLHSHCCVLWCVMIWVCVCLEMFLSTHFCYLWIFFTCLWLRLLTYWLCAILCFSRFSFN